MVRREEPAIETVVFERRLIQDFTAEVKQRFPRKTFGFFLSSRRFGPPERYLVMEENIRDEWVSDFHAYGNYYVDHHDAGFLCTPEETWRVERAIRDSGMVKVGVFHSHQRHPAILTSVDVDFHPSPDLWHLLIVLRNLDYPIIRTFEVTADGRALELDHTVVDSPAAGAPAAGAPMAGDTPLAGVPAGDAPAPAAV